MYDTFAKMAILEIFQAPSVANIVLLISLSALLIPAAILLATLFDDIYEAIPASDFDLCSHSSDALFVLLVIWLWPASFTMIVQAFALCELWNRQLGDQQNRGEEVDDDDSEGVVMAYVSDIFLGFLREYWLVCDDVAEMGCMLWCGHEERDHDELF